MARSIFQVGTLDDIDILNRSLNDAQETIKNARNLNPDNLDFQMSLDAAQTRIDTQRDVLDRLKEKINFRYISE